MRDHLNSFVAYLLRQNIAATARELLGHLVAISLFELVKFAIGRWL